MMKLKSLVVVAAVALGLAGCHEAGAQGHDHGHASHGGEAATAKLTLNDGKKWQTDEQLHAGMAAIRDEVQAALQPIHAKTYSPEDYKALAGRIEGQITNVIAKCKLPSEVDAQIHLVLAEFFAGADQMKKDGNRMGGVVKVIKALEVYPKYFEHPNWKPIKH